MTLQHDEQHGGDVETSSSALVTYFQHRDGADPAGALDLLASDVRYHLMPMPGVQVSGTGRDRLRTTLAGMTGRPGLHRVVAEAVTGEVELVLGHRVEDGEPVGTFLAAATTTGSGEISEYVGAYFDSLNLGFSGVTRVGSGGGQGSEHEGGVE